MAAIDSNALDANICYTYIHFRMKLDYAAAAFGFFVPYFDLDVILLPTPPCASLAKGLIWVSGTTHQIQCSSDQVVFHTRAILRAASSYHDDRMLLYIVT